MSSTDNRVAQITTNQPCLDQIKLLDLPVELVDQISKFTIMANDTIAASTNLKRIGAEPNDFNLYDGYTKVMKPMQASRTLHHLGSNAYFEAREWEVAMVIAKAPSAGKGKAKSSSGKSEAVALEWPWVLKRETQGIRVYWKGQPANFEVIKRNCQHVKLDITINMGSDPINVAVQQIAVQEVEALGQGKLLISEGQPDSCKDFEAGIQRICQEEKENRRPNERLRYTLRAVGCHS